MERGIIYIVTGKKKYKDECFYSASSVKRHNPQLPITLFTDEYSGSKTPFDSIINIPDRTHPLKLKTSYLTRSPYQYSMFLDSDTKIEGNLDELFNTLEHHDFLIGKCPYINFDVRPPKFIGFAHPMDYNTGVFLYNQTSSTITFLNKWAELTNGEDDARMRPGHFCDQHYFNYLINHLNFHREAKINLGLFDNKIYNVRKPIFENLQANEKKCVRIKHWHLLNVSPAYRLLRRIKNSIQKGKLIR
jgi:hypothetical protein